MALPLLIPILSAVAPALLSRVFGAGGGKLAEAAAATVEQVTGVRLDGPEAAEAALARLRAEAGLAADLRARLAELALAETEAHLADRADARERDLALVRQGRVNRRADLMLAAAFAGVVGIAGVMFLLSLSADAENSALVNTLVGFLSGIGGMFARNIGTAFDFEFGSSRSSAEKTQVLEGFAARAQAGAPEDPAAAFRRRMGG